MNKKVGSGAGVALRRKTAALKRRLREAQQAALASYDLLAKALGPETWRGEVVEEAASEQVERSDRAMRAVLARLARIVDPDALSQEQAEQTVQRLREAGLAWDEVLGREWEEERETRGRGVQATLERLIAALQLHHDLDCCCCVELEGERCRFCTTNDALELGERWLALLGVGRGSAQLPLDGIQWERIWYFEELDVIHLIAEVQRAALVQGYYIDSDQGPQNEAQPSAHIQELVQQVLAPFMARLERVENPEDTLPFLKAYAAYWLRRGQKQGRPASALFGLERQVRLQVLHASAPDLDWGTTQPALQESILLPNLLLHILSDPDFAHLSWSSGGVRYRLTRKE